jgi:hypothetical protein
VIVRDNTDAELVNSCNRSLTATEVALLVAALTQAGAPPECLAQLPSLRVIAESATTWPIVEFSVGGRRAPKSDGMRNLADFQYESDRGLFGFFVYERSGALAGMECWSIDGRADPDAWPCTENLIPLKSVQSA